MRVTLFIANRAIHTGTIQHYSPRGVTFTDGFEQAVDFSVEGNMLAKEMDL